MHDAGADEQPRMKCLQLLHELVRRQIGQAGHDHAGQQVDGEPNRVAAPNAPGERGDRHQQTAEDAPFDARGNRMHFFRQLETIADGARFELPDGAGARGHLFCSLRSFHQGFVLVAAAGKQLHDPADQTDDQQRTAEDAKHQAGCDAKGK